MAVSCATTRGRLPAVPPFLPAGHVSALPSVRGPVRSGPFSQFMCVFARIDRLLPGSPGARPAVQGLVLQAMATDRG